jgi:hypothetical protein
MINGVTQSDILYTIYEGALVTTLANMVHHVNCPLTYYVSSISPELSPTANNTLISFDASTGQITVMSDDNFYGNFDYTVTINGVNDEGV